MTTVAQLAVTIALELDLQKDITTTVVRRRKAGWLVPHPPKQRVRTIEERRTFLAVYHLTSALVSYSYSPYISQMLDHVTDITYRQHLDSV